MAITLTQLHSFLAVVRLGSVTAAADELAVTQPSVSAALAALEREIGLELTERDGRRLRLTAAGKAYACYAADVVGLLSKGSRAAREASDVSARELRIAAVNTAGEYLVSPLVRAFQEVHPGIELSLDVDNRQRVLQLVAHHRADVALAGRPSDDLRITGTPFCANQIVLVTARDDALGDEAPVSLQQLASRRWLLRERGSGTRAMSEELLSRHDLRPKTLTFGSNGAIKQAAALGIGVSLQSRLAVDLELASGMLAVLDVLEPLPAREWYVLWASVGPLRPVVQEFIDFVSGDAGRSALDAVRRIPAAAARANGW